MNEEQIQYCEKRFGGDKFIVSFMEMIEYAKVKNKETKVIFWQTMCKEHLFNTYRYVVPGTAIEVETAESARLKEQEWKKKSDEADMRYERSIAELRAYNIKRIFISDIRVNTTCSVLDSLPAQNRRCKFPTITGSMVEVRYEATHPNFRAVPFIGPTVGLWTSGMGDCIGVMFLLGKSMRPGSSFTFGSLAHLPGGNPSGLDWGKMIFNFSPIQLREALRRNVLFAMALICVTPARLAGSATVFDLIRHVIIPLGFGFPQIVVYVGDIPAFAIHKSGCFGVIDRA